MKNKLKDYTEGRIHFTPIMNIMMNNRSKDWYAELGKYITETIDIKKVPELGFYADKLKNKKNLITKITDFMNDGNRVYSSIAIFFLTSALNESTLRKMFGEPIFHNDFGEGFDGEYDEETDEYSDPQIKESYASYFVNVGGRDFHIGYDHRGTSIEIQKPSKFKWDGDISDKTAQNCFDSLKSLVDLFREKCLVV
jgi:hypothetical protein